ncbi:MAG TPA: lysophospholipid acyltransferase family protein [Bryobacteraceae bacterium]|nr:lysophospholipid acyltransferase family protein [Bryobacteraceae bacterium]
MSLLRSLLISTPLIAFSTVFLGTLSLLASLLDSTGRLQHHLARIWGKFLLAVSFIRVRVEGLEKLDPHATYVFVANHGSLMDIPALLSTLDYEFRFFAKKGLYKIPFLGSHLRRAGHLPVDRSSARNSLKSMTEGAHIIAQRHISVLLFPEGGRSAQGLREFKEGAAYIAIKAGVPVVPIAIVGMRPLLPMGSLHIRSGNVTVRIADPISTEGLKLGNRAELNQRLYSEVAGMLGLPPAAESVKIGE